ncbi:MAG: L-ribulose-5-phosphate 4-epimerase AraD [Acidimicrobiales bacterium]|jgi:L-ribulose-5-phosphate 4-epimerase
MIAALKREVREANLELVERGLVFDTFGNVSGIDRDLGLVVIKPSGVPYGELSPDDMAVVALESGEHLEGLKPSSDTPTHLEIYRSFATVGGVAHTHSTWASSWAQAHRSVPCFGTTHADYFRGPVPCSRDLTPEEVAGAYEKETGRVIVETFEALDPDEVPAVLVASHGVFTWGRDASRAVLHAAVVEQVARMAQLSLELSPKLGEISPQLLDRHFLRKHGSHAYYGQVSSP